MVLLISLAFLSLLLSGAIFGFFFVWICSTMWVWMPPIRAWQSKLFRR